ncbi:signal peptidase I, partial [Treponema sp. R6D11]
KEQVITLKGTLSLPAVVPVGQIFVMGDNRNNSHDSRMADVGMIDKTSIIGKAIFRMWPFGNPKNLFVSKEIK